MLRKESNAFAKDEVGYIKKVKMLGSKRKDLIHTKNVLRNGRSK